MNEQKVDRGWRTLALSTVASAVLLAASITLPGHSATDGSPAGPVANMDVRNGFADLIEQVEPSVVTIEVNKTMEARPSAFGGDPRAEEFFERFFGQRGVTPRQPRQAQGVGSGFVIDESGYIVTNNHVIDGADTVIVRLIDGTEHDASVIGIDSQTDLALLKIDAENLVATRLGDSDETRVGDWVVAIGNPFGLGGTATAGIVSARSRDIRSGPYDDYLQIDAPINRGNSGGPVFNTDGEVVGVNTAIFSPNGGSVGIGFAIPVNQVRDIVDELRSDGSIDRGWLGVQLQSIDRDLADSLGLDSRNGALVADVVAGSPAQRAGIEVGDVIVGFDNEEVANSRELARLVGNSDSGDKASIVVIRGGDQISLKVRLGDAATQIAANDQEQKLQDLGLTLAPLTEELRQRLEVDDGIDGAVVVRIDPDGSAAASGLRRGDILMRADRRQVESPQDFETALSAARKKGRNSLPVLVRRGESQQFMSLSTG